MIQFSLTYFKVTSPQQSFIYKNSMTKFNQNEKQRYIKPFAHLNIQSLAEAYMTSLITIFAFFILSFVHNQFDFLRTPLITCLVPVMIFNFLIMIGTLFIVYYSRRNQESANIVYHYILLYRAYLMHHYVIGRFLNCFISIVMLRLLYIMGTKIAQNQGGLPTLDQMITIPELGLDLGLTLVMLDFFTAIIGTHIFHKNKDYLIDLYGHPLLKALLVNSGVKTVAIKYLGLMLPVGVGFGGFFMGYW
jgi:hypothetical protein